MNVATIQHTDSQKIHQVHPQKDVFFYPSQKRACLILKNGSTYSGKTPEWQTSAFSGEVVFTTGMTGFVETLTDPSYAGQIVVFTYPLIGNYGVPHQRHWESKKIYAAGVVVEYACEAWSHYQGEHSIYKWLEDQNVPLLTKVDTRALTRQLRNGGCTPGIIDCGEKMQENEYVFIDPNEEDLVARVSISKKKIFGAGAKKIIAVDCGMKEGIMYELLSYDTTVIRVPHDYDYTQEDYDGVFISNGPGDPQKASITIALLKKAMQKEKPVFGICLGSQLLALAAGAQTYKLPYGHRGHNQPCIDVDSGKCVVTSQNHGYAVDEKSLSEQWRVSHRNLNDHSVEGIRHKKLPFFSVQFHPEGRPGPTDSQVLFKKFYELL